MLKKKSFTILLISFCRLNCKKISQVNLQPNMSTCLAMILPMHSGRSNLKMSIHSFIGFSTCVSAYLLQIFSVWIYYHNWILSAKKQMWTSACLAMPTHRGIYDLKKFPQHAYPQWDIRPQKVFRITDNLQSWHWHDG